MSEGQSVPYQFPFSLHNCFSHWKKHFLLLSASVCSPHSSCHRFIFFSSLLACPLLSSSSFSFYRERLPKCMCVCVCVGMKTSVCQSFLPASPTSSAACISKVHCSWVNMKEIKQINLDCIASFGDSLLSCSVSVTCIYYFILSCMNKICMWKFPQKGIIWEKWLKFCYSVHVVKLKSCLQPEINFLS